MSNEELCVKIQHGEDLMDQLWLQNKQFVAMIAKKYDSMAEMDDLMQEGYLGLLQAVTHWDPDENVEFLTYGYYWIRQSMVRFVEKNRGVSVSMQTKIRRLDKTISEFNTELGREPSDFEICDFMGISEKELASIKEAEYKQNTASLDAPVNTDQGDATLGDLMPGNDDPESMVLNEIYQEELREVLWDQVDKLPDDQPEIIRRRYQEGKTLKEIGDQEGKTVDQIAWREKRALRKLKYSKEIKSVLDDQIYSEGLRGNGSGSFSRSWTSSTERIAVELYGNKQRNEN